MEQITQNKDLLSTLKAEFLKNKKLSEPSIALVKKLSEGEQQELKSYALTVMDQDISQSIDNQFNKVYRSLLQVNEKLNENSLHNALQEFENDDDHKMNELMVAVIQDEDTSEDNKDLLRVKLLQKNALLINKAFQSFSRPDDGKISNDDLFQECQVAFLKAIDTFDPTKGIKFSTYATTVMRNAICGIFQNKINRRREKEYSLNNTIPNSKSIEPTELLDFVADEEKTPEEAAETDTNNAILYRAINRLQPDRKFVAYIRYELGGIAKTSQFEIADFTGASQTNISKIEAAMKTDLEAFLCMEGLNGEDL